MLKPVQTCQSHDMVHAWRRQHNLTLRTLKSTHNNLSGIKSTKQYGNEKGIRGRNEKDIYKKLKICNWEKGEWRKGKETGWNGMLLINSRNQLSFLIHDFLIRKWRSHDICNCLLTTDWWVGQLVSSVPAQFTVDQLGPAKAREPMWDKSCCQIRDRFLAYFVKDIRPVWPDLDREGALFA